MKKTSLYLVAALAATTFITQAQANYLGEGQGYGIDIDHDKLNKLNDQECRDYVTQQIRKALPARDRQTLRKISQAKAMLKGVEARKAALDESLQTITGHRADNEDWEKLLRNTNMY